MGTTGDRARAREGRRISLTLLVITGLVLGVLVTAIMWGLNVTSRIEQQAEANRAVLRAVSRQTLAQRCASDHAHRQMELLIVEVVRRAGGDVKNLEIIELPEYCTEQGDVRIDDRGRIIDEQGRPLRPQPDGRMIPPPPPAERTRPPSSPSPTPTCILPPPLCDLPTP